MQAENDLIFSFIQVMNTQTIHIEIILVVNTLWTVLLLPLILLLMKKGVIDREERYLERKFGEHYLRYKASVRRWL